VGTDGSRPMITLFDYVPEEQMKLFPWKKWRFQIEKRSGNYWL